MSTYSCVSAAATGITPDRRRSRYGDFPHDGTCSSRPIAVAFTDQPSGANRRSTRSLPPRLGRAGMWTLSTPSSVQYRSIRRSENVSTWLASCARAVASRSPTAIWSRPVPPPACCCTRDGSKAFESWQRGLDRATHRVHHRRDPHAARRPTGQPRPRRLATTASMARRRRDANG